MIFRGTYTTPQVIDSTLSTTSNNAIDGKAVSDFVQTQLGDYVKTEDLVEPTKIPSDLSNLNDILTCTKEDKPITLAKMEIQQKGNTRLATTGITNSIALDASGGTLEINPDGVYVGGTKLNLSQVDNAITFESDWNGVSFAHVFGGIVVMEILINNTEDKPFD
jgi:hypothetical protein